MQVTPFNRCLAHLTVEERGGVLAALEPGADIDARGTTFTEDLLQELLSAVHDEQLGQRQRVARGRLVRLSEGPGPRFGVTRFDRATFEGAARFESAWFEGDASFNDSRCKGDGSFSNTLFEGAASFSEMVFEGKASFQFTRFMEEARFRGARFEIADRSGPIFAKQLDLDRVVFLKAVVINVIATSVWCFDARFEGGAILRLQHARLEINGTKFLGPSMITSYSTVHMLFMHDWPGPSTVLLDEPVDSTVQDPTPQLVSLAGVDAANLVVTDIGLARCRFAGAHNLDQLRIEGRGRFTSAPSGLWIGWAWPPVWWWTRRQTLAEEREWRASQRKRAGWPDGAPLLTDVHSTFANEAVHDPERLAALYRALRKALEDSRNEPGAADFYYGEMEMRRHSRSTPLPERIIISLYWLISGYGLRAARALVCLAVIIIAMALVLQHAGFPTRHNPGYLDALLYSTQSTLSLDLKTSAIPASLTRWGQAMRIVLRVAGPVLLGLGALAIRNRVKR